MKALVAAGLVRVTRSASNGAQALGIENIDGMCAVVMALMPRDFHKSMTTHIDHRVWQDVCHVRTAAGMAVYLKLTVIDDVLIVSFKELRP